MIETEGEDCDKLKKKFAEDSKVLEQARIQLKNLHQFYTKSEISKFIWNFTFCNSYKM